LSPRQKAALKRMARKYMSSEGRPTAAADAHGTVAAESRA
jgi:hypothetical protein